MPYDEKLDERIADETQDWQLIRKKMFGGTCYLLDGNMLCGVYKDYLIIRLHHQEGAEALQEPFVQPFNITGRPMKGWIMIEENGFRGDRLRRWLEKSQGFCPNTAEKIDEPSRPYASSGRKGPDTQSFLKIGIIFRPFHLCEGRSLKRINR